LYSNVEINFFAGSFWGGLSVKRSSASENGKPMCKFFVEGLKMIKINDIVKNNIIWGLDLDQYNDNINVSVTLNDGCRFWAQIFTIL
jgi:hypothetical protein